MTPPCITLGVGTAAVLARFLAAGIAETMTRDFVVTARAKGLAPGQIIVRHVLRNAVIPAVTALGIQIGRLIGGAVTDGGCVQPARSRHAAVERIGAARLLCHPGGDAPGRLAVCCDQSRNRHRIWHHRSSHPHGRAVMFRSTSGALGTAVLIVVLLIALTAPFIAPYDPLAQDLDHALQLPTMSHWLGTDDLGRDLLSRLMLGTRVSVAVGFRFGDPRAGDWYRGGTDRGLPGGMAQRHHHARVRCVAGLPGSAAGHAGGDSVAGGHNGRDPVDRHRLPADVRTARASGDAGAAASHLRGCGDRVRRIVDDYVIFRAVLPNVLAPLSCRPHSPSRTRCCWRPASSFLSGLGIQPPNPSLGLMLQEARGYIRSDAWFGICPGVLLILIVLALNAAADTLGQLADPRAATRGRAGGAVKRKVTSCRSSASEAAWWTCHCRHRFIPPGRAAATRPTF